jgi:hypothetical protein
MDQKGLYLPLHLRNVIKERLETPQKPKKPTKKKKKKKKNRATNNRTSPWQVQYGFTHGGLPSGASPEQIYNDIAGANQREREFNLATMIGTAYNGPNIITTRNTSSLPGSRTHGGNAGLIAGDLYDLGLFRPLSRP